MFQYNNSFSFRNFFCFFEVHFSEGMQRNLIRTKKNSKFRRRLCSIHLQLEHSRGAWWSEPISVHIGQRSESSWSHRDEDKRLHCEHRVRMHSQSFLHAEDPLYLVEIFGRECADCEDSEIVALCGLFPLFGSHRGRDHNEKSFVARNEMGKRLKTRRQTHKKKRNYIGKVVRKLAQYLDSVSFLFFSWL